jgi:Ran GTPase-activating protein (RanGAP) involved in mRNA processing and transport
MLPLHSAMMIRGMRHLRVLYIKSNPIGAEGVQYIADAMQFNRVIRELCLQQNNLRSQVSEYLGAMLLVNRTLEVFHMVHNTMETPDLMDLQKYHEVQRILYNISS